MNLVDWEQTGIARVVSEIRHLARQYGADIDHCELIGLAPAGALLEVAAETLAPARLQRRPGPRAATGQGPMSSLRADLRAAVEAARDRAEAAGELRRQDGRRLAPDQPRATGTSRARRLRHQRRHAAGAGRARLTDADRRDAEAATSACRPASREVSVAPPGFLNMRLDPAWVAGQVGAILEAGPELRRRARRAPAQDQRRVRIGQPDRSADRGQRAWRLRRRPPLPRARGGRPRGDARVLLQRLQRPGAATSASRSQARREGRADAGGRLPRRLRARAADAGARRALGRRPTRRRRRRRRGAGPLGLGAGARRDRGEPGPRSASASTYGPAKGSHPRPGLGHARRRAAARRRPHLRGRWRDLVPLDGLRGRQGSGGHPLQRAAHLLRVGPRLHRAEVQPRLRGADLPVGRGPPRDGGAQPGRRPGAGLRRRARCSGC